MADKSQSLVLDALSRAVTEPDGLPLFGSKTAVGLFTTNAAGKQAARHVVDDGLVRVLRVEAKGKSTQEICGLTDKGLALLLAQANPRLVLEAFVGALDARRQQVEALVASAHASQEHLNSLRLVAEKILEHLRTPQAPTPPERNGKHASDPAQTLLAHLASRHDAGALDDCPLPELFQKAQARHADLTTGAFHDLLRCLHAEGKIYLHPWTGPLYELPEPACALLVGHEVAYYASVRH